MMYGNFMTTEEYYKTYPELRLNTGHLALEDDAQELANEKGFDVDEVKFVEFCSGYGWFYSESQNEETDYFKKNNLKEIERLPR